MRLVGWFSTLVGLAMLGMWSVFLVTGGVPELVTAPVAIGFHLVAEGVTAALLLLSGVALLKRQAWAERLYLVAAGALLYTLINSPGYFAQQGEWALVVMFALLFVLAVLSVASVLHGVVKERQPLLRYRPQRRLERAR